MVAVALTMLRSGGRMVAVTLTMVRRAARLVASALTMVRSDDDDNDDDDGARMVEVTLMKVRSWAEMVAAAMKEAMAAALPLLPEGLMDTIDERPTAASPLDFYFPWWLARLVQALRRRKKKARAPLSIEGPRRTPPPAAHCSPAVPESTRVRAGLERGAPPQQPRDDGLLRVKPAPAS